MVDTRDLKSLALCVRVRVPPPVPLCNTMSNNVCKRCKILHTCKPFNFKDTLAKAAKQLSDEIDKEFLFSIMVVP